ncbi:MAG: RluA family pseudouridine synthase [Terrimonas sp.]|nr:RluA family pseudouridine synthase [Terrimonas sp.]
MKISDLLISEDDDIIAINKPSGLLTIPNREANEISLKDLLIEKYGQVFVVHRLDRETSGMIIFAKNEKAHRHFSLQFENRETEKIYQGLVLGTPDPTTGTINAPIAEHSVKRGMMIIHRRGKTSITDYALLRDFKRYAWLQFQIHTGRTHQIRIHMKELGNPIVCDPLYGDGKPVLLSSLKKKFNLSKNELEEKPILNRLALHAFQLSITGPGGKVYTLQAPLHKDLRALLQQLEKNSSA